MAITYSSPFRRLPFLAGIAGRDSIGLAALVALHGTALTAIYLTEYGPFGLALALFAWTLLNFLWLIVVRRPAVAAALSLAMIGFIISLSQLKFNILEMTLSFFDVLVIDADTVAFLLTIFPELRIAVVIIALVAIPLFIILWRL